MTSQHQCQNLQASWQSYAPHSQIDLQKQPSMQNEQVLITNPQGAKNLVHT